MFGLAGNESGDASPPFIREGSLLLVNARSGISVLVEILSPGQVWLPSYLCGVMVQAVSEAPGQSAIRFYEVEADLALSSTDWLGGVQRGDLVVLIDYFGFPLDATIATGARRRGAWILEDACQALLSADVGRHSDFVIYSPRKFLGVPDGGILIDNAEALPSDVESNPPPARWWLQALEATVLRREFDQCGGDRRWFELFQEADANGPIGSYSMSELSRLLLVHSFDYASICQERIQNYEALGQSLGEFAVFPELPAGVVPLGFPIRLSERDRVRQVLFGHNIYPPVHWPIHGVVPERFRASHHLAGEILTLVCDQRYSVEDMERMAHIVRTELSQ